MATKPATKKMAKVEGKSPPPKTKAKAATTTAATKGKTKKG